MDRKSRIAPTNLRLRALTVAAIGALAAYAMYYFFVTTAAGQRVDEIAYDGSALGRTRLWRFADPILDVVSIGFVVLVLVIAATVAIWRQRWLLIVQVAIVMGGANIATQLFKHFVSRPELGVFGTAGASPGVNTLPSGHTTVAATAAIAVLFISPPRVRPFAALVGTVYAAGTGVSTLIGWWHRASDVVAAMFVALAFAGVALLLDRPRRPVASGERAVVIVLAIVGVLTAIVSIWALLYIWRYVGIDPAYDLVANRAELSRGTLLTAYAGGALACVSVACAIVAAVVAQLQRRGD